MSSSRLVVALVGALAYAVTVAVVPTLGRVVGATPGVLAEKSIRALYPARDGPASLRSRILHHAG